MFEYWFHGLDDGDGIFTHHGHTHDFLEVISQVAQCFDDKVAGDFVSCLIRKERKNLSFLRVIDWKIEYNQLLRADQKIVLHKLR